MNCHMSYSPSIPRLFIVQRQLSDDGHKGFVPLWMITMVISMFNPIISTLDAPTIVETFNQRLRSGDTFEEFKQY